MRKTTTIPPHNSPSESKPDHHEHLIRLDRVRQQKLIQVANEHGMSPHDLVIKALDAFFVAHIK
jgi:hypothetical protein